MTSRDLIAIVAILLLVGALVAPAMFLDRVFVSRHTDTVDVPWSQSPDRIEGADEQPANYAMSDKFNLLYPDQVYGRTEAERGHLAEWNPHVLGGVPHAANPLTAVFYPINWALLLVEPQTAPLVSAAIHVLLAGLFVFLFLRMIGLSAFSAAFGGCCFAFSGWVAAHLQNTQLVATVTWWPLGLFAIEARLRGHGRWSLMILSLAFAMMWLSGFPQLAVLGSFVMAAWTVCGLAAHIREDGRSFVLRTAGGILLFTLIGLLLASVQLLPTLALMEHAGHQDATTESQLSERFRGAAWAGIVMPGFMGGPDADWQTHWGAIIGLGEGPARPALPPNAMNWSERTIYPGILTLCLAIVGLIYARDRVRWGLVVLAALGVLMSSSELIIRGLSHVPVMNVGAPSRAVVLFPFAIACLAGCGFQVLLDGKMPKVMARVKAVSIATVVPLALLAIVTGWAFFAEESFLEALIGFLTTTGAADRLAPPGQLPEMAKCVELLREDLPDLQGDLLRLLVIGGSGWALFMLRIRRPNLSWTLAGVTCVIVLADLLTHFVPPNEPVTAEGLFRETAGIRWLKQNAGTDRIMRVSASEAAAVQELGTLFVPNVGLLYGLHDAQGWREQVPLWYPDYWKGVAAATAPTGVSGLAVEQAGSLAVDLARVRYLLARQPISALSEHQVFPPAGAPGGGMTIYENENALPRAWVVHKARCLPDDETRALVRAGTVDPRSEVILTEWPPNVSSQYPTSEGTNEVTFTRQDPGRLEIDVNTRGAGWLIVNDTWYPNWRAWIDDDHGRREVPIVRAWTTFMAIPVGEGRQHVEISYQPTAITTGVVLTGLGWIGFLLLPLFGPSRPASRRVSRSIEPPALTDEPPADGSAAEGSEPESSASPSPSAES